MPTPSSTANVLEALHPAQPPPSSQHLPRVETIKGIKSGKYSEHMQSGTNYINQTTKIIVKKFACNRHSSVAWHWCKNDRSAVEVPNQRQRLLWPSLFLGQRLMCQRSSSAMTPPNQALASHAVMHSTWLQCHQANSPLTKPCFLTLA